MTILVALAGTPALAQQHTWLDQFGSANAERAAAVSAGMDAVYVGGWIDRGALDGLASSGGTDAFLRCYNAEGAVVWTRQFGSSTTDRAQAVARYGNGCLVAGMTLGSMSGANAGGADGFVQRRNADGDVLWTTQFGSSGTDEVTGVAADNSHVYVVGWTDGVLPMSAEMADLTPNAIFPAGAVAVDAFILKLDLDGNVIWTRQFGTLGFDKAYAVGLADGGVYVTGRVGSAMTGQTHFGSADVFVARYDADGNQIWARQHGTTSSDIGYALAADAGGVYVAGTTRATFPGQLSFGDRDAFVLKYSHTGNVVWTRQIGGTGWDEGYAIGVDASGVYVGGRTGAGLIGLPPSASSDAFMVKLDPDGAELTVDQLGSSSVDETSALSVSPRGAFATGWTMGQMPGATAMGDRDAFIARYDVPEAPVAMRVATIDIKPGKCPNILRPKHRGDKGKYDGKGKMGHKKQKVVRVAILGSAELDVSTIDPASVSLNGLAPVRKMKIADKFSVDCDSACKSVYDCVDYSGQFNCSRKGVDGFDDMIVEFLAGDLLASLEPIADGDVRECILTATLVGGELFEGRDNILYVSRKPDRGCGGALKSGGEGNVSPPAAEAGISLGGAFPNPFNPVTRISYYLPGTEHVELDVYDARGRLVERLISSTQPAGEHFVEWNANGTPSGVNIYRLRAGDFARTEKMILLK